MKITHLGHESWIVEVDGSRVLIDPILGDTFGSSTKGAFCVLPRRTLSDSIISGVENLVLTTEHFQHFDLGSFRRWISLNRALLTEKKLNVWIPRFVSTPMRDLMSSWGLNIKTLDFNSVFTIFHGTLEGMFLAPDPETLVWDARVASLAIRDLKKPDRPWAVFQSDTLLNRSLKFPESWGSYPAVVVLTNHLKLWDEPGFSPRDNLTLPELDTHVGSKVLGWMKSLLPNENQTLRKSSSFLITGGAYELADFDSPPHSIENGKLAQMIDELALNVSIRAAEVGDQFDVSRNGVSDAEKHPGIQVFTQFEKVLKKREPFAIYPVSQSQPLTDEKLLQELNRHYVSKLLVTPFGEELIFSDFYLDGPTGPKRFVVQLVDENSEAQFVLDLSLGQFVLEEFDGDLAIRRFPFGARVYRKDLSDLFQGNLTIGEIIFAGFRQWGPSVELEKTPFGSFLTCFSESFSLEISRRRCQKLSERFSKEPL